jgi:hypothetical protein
MPAGKEVTTTLGGGSAPVTVTVVFAVDVPPGPVAVSVYVVVAEGCTIFDPDTDWEPMPASIVTLVAFNVSHERVVLLPAGIEPGLDVNDPMTGGAAEADLVVENVR